jgi:glutamate dehydrogenase/leucine dehydrogenase
MACEQFRVIADYLNIDQNDRDRLMYPKRAIAVTLPVHMDDGSTRLSRVTASNITSRLGRPKAAPVSRPIFRWAKRRRWRCG